MNLEEKEITITPISQDESGPLGPEGLDPLTALQELRENSVPKSDFEKVLAERNKYFKAIIDGQKPISGEEKAPTDDDIQGLRKKLFNGEKDLSNLEYVETALKLRNAIIDRDGVDIFVGKGNKYAPTENDYECAERTAQALQACVDVAEGDSAIFTRELARITRDVAPTFQKINPKIRR